MMMLQPTFYQSLMDSINQWDVHTLLFLVLWSIFSVTWYTWIFSTTKVNSNLPPGPPGLPLFGNLLSLDPELHKYFTTLSQTYGPLFSLRLGSKYCIVVSSPSMARQVLKDNDVIFANHDISVASRVVFYGGCDVVFSPYGSEWRMLRKVLVQWMSNSTTMDSVHLFRREEIRKAVGHLCSRVGLPVDIGDLMFLTVLNMNRNAIFGGTVEGDGRTIIGTEFREVVALIMELIGKPNLSDLFPVLAWFDLQGVEKQMRMSARKIDQIFEKMIEQRLKKKEISGSDEAEDSKDFLEFLFKMKDEQDSKTPLTMANIKSLLAMASRYSKRNRNILPKELQKLSVPPVGNLSTATATHELGSRHPIIPSSSHSRPSVSPIPSCPSPFTPESVSRPFLSPPPSSSSPIQSPGTENSQPPIAQGLDGLQPWVMIL